MDISVDAVAAALKSGFLPEMEAVMRTTTPHNHHHHHHYHPQALNDEVSCGGGDESFVDGFLDFSNEEVDGFLSENQEEAEKQEEEGEAEEEEEDEVEEEAEKDCSCGSVLSVEETHLGITSNSNSNDDFEPALCVPTDELESLEWLSHFVEDSFSKFPSSSDSVLISRETPIPNEGEKGRQQQQQKQIPTRTESREKRTGFFALTMETPVPAKARSKRSRTGGRVWSFNHPHHFTESSPTSSSSTISSSSSSSSLQSSPSSCLIFPNTARNQDLFYSPGKPPGRKPKKAKKNPLPSASSASENSQLQSQRRCSHCLVQKTPQWRTGPLGAKTLCNACGVRYKSGRLLPEYRPAGSPTFLSTVHSNSHRKVLEMRRKKEVAAPEPGLLAVQSF